MVVLDEDSIRADQTGRRRSGCHLPSRCPLSFDAERAAPTLTEVGSRLPDRTDPVPDAVFDEAAEHCDELALAALVRCIAAVTIWNRLAIITGQEAGERTARRAN
jgi:alkylhydroperoxidase family enzyme